VTSTVSRLRALLPYCSGLLVTTAYGLITYLAMKLNLASAWFTLMSWAFIISLPVAIGACAVALAPPDRRGTAWHLLGVPWIAALLVALIPLLFAWEVIICVAMALPIFLPLATLGAALAWVAFRSVGQRSVGQQPALLIMLLPYLVAPVESWFAAPDSLHVVQNSVVVEASPEAVWRQIVRVPAIGREEQRWSVLHWLGLPRPVEATLSGQGIGAVRHASFEGGLVFVETVNEWQDRRSLGFSIVRDQTSAPPEPFGAIGGPFFDMLDGRYEIEPLGPDRVRLHLSSTHRLTTRFNWYAGLWTEPIMSELQRYILAIVKARSQLPVR
jgi:hypothetical protein